NFSQIGVPQAWSWGQGQGVTVAVIDTGIAWQSADGRPAVEDLEDSRIVPGYDFVNDNNLALDDNSHGTHVAGTIAQSTHNGLGLTGIAHKAKLMPVKVLSGDGSGSILDVADGIRFAADHGANIINMSLGSSFDSRIIHNAVRYANKRGVLVVCAAGNEGSFEPSYPAAYPEAISVSAVNNQGLLAFYSNRGDTIDIAAPGGELSRDMSQEDMWASGICQNTLNPFDPSEQGYYTFQGTSMASPHVAGVAALLAGQGVNNPKMMRKILSKTAQGMTKKLLSKTGQNVSHRENARKINGYGAGVVDAEEACRYAVLYLGLLRLVAALVMIWVFFELLKNKYSVIYLTFASLVAVFSSCGLFFMPLICPTYCIDLGPWMYGVTAWDMFIFGASGHGNLLFYSALIPCLLLWAVDKFKFSDLTKMLVCGIGLGFVSNFVSENFIHGVNLAIVPSSLRSIWLIANSVVIMLFIFKSLDKPEDEVMGND
ncbi:peptidase S8, partial [bacterium]|nr:peptidase S8 [bacterium]